MQQDTQRRAVLGAGAAFIGWQSAVAGQTSQPSAVDSDSMTVTLLGTGSPVPVPDRFGMATLVQAGGLNLMFDAGRGCSIRLNQAGVPMGSIDGVFITHFHSDHLNGLPDMWMTGYLNTVYARRRRPLEIIGPRGIARIAASMRDCYADDIRIRMADEKVAAASTEIAAHEFDGDGVVFDRNGVRVTAFAVDHGALIKPACGYRIDHGGRSVLLSGDTRFDENLIARGQGLNCWCMRWRWHRCRSRRWAISRQFWIITPHLRRWGRCLRAPGRGWGCSAISSSCATKRIRR